jgi:DNA-binding GntR family transcriptional regulator
MTKTDTPRKKELANESVYRAVKNMILLNVFKPGCRLNVEKLRRELGVGRTPAWEAIRRLEQEGVVTKILNRGVFMRENSLMKVYETIEVLGAVETLAARLACERITDSTLVKLSQCLPDQLRGIETGDMAVYGPAEMRFHRLIYEASRNSFLLEVFDTIALRMLPSRVNHRPALPSIFLIHQEIIEGLASGDVDKVQKALGRHIEIMLNLIRDQMQLESERDRMVESIRKDFAPLKKPKRKRPNTKMD